MVSCGWSVVMMVLCMSHPVSSQSHSFLHFSTSLTTTIATTNMSTIGQHRSAPSSAFASSSSNIDDSMHVSSSSLLLDVDTQKMSVDIDTTSKISHTIASSNSGTVNASRPLKRGSVDDNTSFLTNNGMTRRNRVKSSLDNNSNKVDGKIAVTPSTECTDNVKNQEEGDDTKMDVDQERFDDTRSISSDSLGDYTSAKEEHSDDEHVDTALLGELTGFFPRLHRDDTSSSMQASKHQTFSHCLTNNAISTTSYSPAKCYIKHIQSMQRIIDLNDTAVECYRSGEYDATLDALAEAEYRRERLVKSIARGNTSSNGVAPQFNGIMQTAPFQPLLCRQIESDSSSLQRAESTSTSSIARTSYNYQRMDFDEGMHSYATAEKLDASTFWVVPPSSISNEMKTCELSPVVEATLVFNVGQVHRRRGEFDTASTSYELALNILQNSTSTSTAMIYNLLIPILHNMGQLLYRRGDLPMAMETYNRALDYAQIMHGESHVDVASALNCLGVLHYHANSADSDDEKINKVENSSTSEAMELFQKSLVIRTNCIGHDHVDVATTLNNIGRIHVQLDEFDEALGYYEDSLRIRRNCLGTNSLDYAATAFNAGQSLHQLGNLDEAADLYREFLRVALMKFGHSHRDVAVVLSGIAQIHQEKKEYDKALELYEESLCAGKAALGENHSEIAMLYNRIGNFYFERERLGDAMKCYKRGLRIEKRVLPSDHPNIVVTLSNLGEIHRQRNEWDDAAKMYIEALDILRKKHKREDNAEVASTLNTIGLIHDQRGDTCVSLHYLQDALLMRRRLLLNNNDDEEKDSDATDQKKLDVAETLVYVGTTLYRKSVFSVAIELFTEALQLREKVLGKDHRGTAFVLYNIALVHQQRGCYEQAIEFFEETLRVEKIVLGENHRDVSMTMFKLGEVYKSAGDLKAALRCFKESLEVERSLTENTASLVGRRQQPSDPAAMARTLTEIGNIHLAHGDTADMMNAFNEASRLYRMAGLSPNNVVVSGHLFALELSCGCHAPAA
jgi:tetratricopeptide (TPR) repeat protein